jgi:hypothetical protein
VQEQRLDFPGLSFLVEVDLRGALHDRVGLFVGVRGHEPDTAPGDVERC